MDELRAIKDNAARAMGRAQYQLALNLYGELAVKEPIEGTWPLRAGDAARKLGKHKIAIRWYERAAATYSERGFVVRAIAVGKMIESLDPGNDRVLRTLDAAQKTSKSTPSSVPAPSVAPKFKQGPPLSGRLNGPPLHLKSETDIALPSTEIVFDDVDDGIPIQATDIIAFDDLVETDVDVTEYSEEDLLSRLPSFPLFQVLPQGAFLDVVSQMAYKVLEAGQVILRQGESGTTMYAIIEGQALVYLEEARDLPLATLEAGDIFGEMALVLDQPRAATVEALTDIEVFEMERDLFHSVLEEYSELGDVLSRMIKRRLVKNVMATAPLFQQLDQRMRKELMFRFEVREVPAKTRIVEEGTPSDGLYVMLAGKVEVTKKSRVAALLRPGQSFGVASLIDSDHCSPTGFFAPVDTLVLRLPRSGFHEVISCYPPVLAHLAEVAEHQQAWGDTNSVVVV